MRKEFSTLLQFIVIAGLSVVFFYIVLPIKYPEISVEALKSETVIVVSWIYFFIGFSAIRFGVCYANLRKTSIETNKSWLTILFDEVSKTSQYFLIAIVSVFFAFWLFLTYMGAGNRFLYDLISIWFGIRHASLIWLLPFTVLSLIRLGIVSLYQFFRK